MLCCLLIASWYSISSTGLSLWTSIIAFLLLDLSGLLNGPFPPKGDCIVLPILLLVCCCLPVSSETPQLMTDPSLDVALCSLYLNICLDLSLINGICCTCAISCMSCISAL
jgi:hypothetical protein